MKTRSVILLTLDAFDGKIGGKTLLQKRLYFMSQFLGEDWGYHAHFYGPYSDVVASELVTLKVQGLVDEAANSFGVQSSSGFERVRYDYALSDAGKEAVQWLKAEYPDETVRIQDAARRVVAPGTLDYMDLSIAAKAYFILKTAEGQPVTTADIAAKAKQFAWDVTPPQIGEACRFLEALHLVRNA